MIARCARCQGTFTTDRFGRQTCPHCGSELILADPNAPPAPSGAQEPSAPPAPPLPPPPPGGGWGPPGGGGWGGPPQGPGPDVPSPFAERATRGFFAAFFETWKLVATQPQEFFRRVRIDQTGSAILFGVLASFVGTAVASMYNLLMANQFLAAMGPAMEKMSEDEARSFRHFMDVFLSGRATLGQIVLVPIATLVSMYVGAAILHVLLMLFRGANRSFDATLTVVAYANGLNLLLVVPGCGRVVAVVWALVVLVIGLAEIQRCGSGKAAAAVFAPAILLCVCCCGALGLGVPAFLKGLEQAAKHGDTVNL